MKLADVPAIAEADLAAELARIDADPSVLSVNVIPTTTPSRGGHWHILVIERAA